MKEAMFLILLLLVSFLFTWLFRFYAIRKSLLDIPNDRSSHTIPTPRGGGIAIAFTWLGGIIWLFINGFIDNFLFYSFVIGLLLSAVGLADDIINLKPGVRFIVQFIVAAFGLYFLGGLKILDFGFLKVELSETLLWFLLFTVLSFIAIVWFINLFNFLDGIDGYLGTEMVFLGLSFYYFTSNPLFLVLIACVGGFLIWNWPKAKIFMGDVGSTLCGYIIIGSIIYFQNTGEVSIIASLILTSVFWFDATITIIRRFLNKEQLSVAHRKHAFQRIVQAGFSHQKTVLFTLGLNSIGFILAYFSVRWHSLSIIFLITDIVIISYIYYLIERIKPFNDSNEG